MYVYQYSSYNLPLQNIAMYLHIIQYDNNLLAVYPSVKIDQT